MPTNSTIEDKTQWSGSDIRIPPRLALMRMSEPKDHWKILIAVKLWI
jgi:hypothetical protein